MYQALFYSLYNYCHLILLTVSEMGTITNPISDKKAESQRIQVTAKIPTEAVLPINSLASTACPFFPPLL